jgi:cytochrome c biogenesis protein CcmG, thiol:disulfide interchange protein DsbE
MRRLALPIVAGLAAGALLALLAFGLLTRDTSAEVTGRRPPQAALPRLDGGRLSLRELRGRVVVVNVFASWCPPCREETPMLEREHRRLEKAGATVVGVTYNDNAPDSRAFARKHGVTFPLVRDVDERFAHGLGVAGIPETFVLDKRGRVAAYKRSAVDAAWIRAAVRKAS